MQELEFLNQPITKIQGVGEKAAEALARIRIRNVKDLLLHIPINILERKFMPPILKDGEQVILQLNVEILEQPNSKFSRNKPYKIYCSYNKYHVNLVYFNFAPYYIIDKLSVNQKITVCGKLDFFGKEYSISHPEIDITGSNKFIKTQVIYPLTRGLTSSQLTKYVSMVFRSLKNMPEDWISNEIKNNNSWLNFKENLFALHHATKESDLNITSNLRRRLAYDELLATQLSLHIFRTKRKKEPGREFNFKGDLSQNIITDLGYELTEGQKATLQEIIQDQKSDFKMFRLIQGDVGCGKTLVALSAMANVIESGPYQCALMAPTDILANQHYEWIKPRLEKYNIHCVLLTGKITGKKRQEILEKIASGQAQIIIGTHALFQNLVEFKDLALVVIDEQHRFGVEQRNSLINKGKNADILSMSATPIPRTLTLALYGDMDISRIIDKPKGRVEITTLILAIYKANELIDSFKKLIEQGERIYWICPLIEEQDSENELPTKAVLERFEEFEKLYPGQVSIVHGKMNPQEKEANLQKFASGEVSILVATTVIEVGINVPEATIMVIEQAEKFGLSQLHQLRGRVGRGSKKSYCMLLYSYPLSNNAKERLQILKESNDGFLIAEKDLSLRGAGNIAGIKQSGLPDFRIAILPEDSDLLIAANNQAKAITQRGTLPDNIKFLLEFFGYQREMID